MARSKVSIYTNYPLAEKSQPLTDLEDFCEEWGNISRAEATQRIMIAWSKARHGDLSALGAMGISFAVPVVASAAPAGELVPERMPEPKAPSAGVGKRPLTGNAKAVELDL